jgi:uncharacterized protein
MKPSRFNLFIPVEENQYLAFNARSCALGLLSQEQYHQVQDQDYEKLAHINTKLFEDLKRGGFLVEDETDELSQLQVERNLARWNTTSLGLTIAPTLRCNFACTYCYEYKHDVDMTSEVADALIEFVKARARGLKGLNVTWYGGEPLLGFKQIEQLSKAFLQLADEYHFAYGAMIVTNGSLLTPQIVQKLVNLKMNSAQVTLDGPEAVHNQRRPFAKSTYGSYQVIMRNLIRAVQHLRISLRVNVAKDNVDNLPALLDDLKTRNLHDKIFLYFAPVVDLTAGVSLNPDLCFSNFSFAPVQTELYKLALTKGFKIKYHPWRTSEVCMAPMFNSYLIDPFGHMHKCWTTITENEKGWSVGHIVHRKFFSNQLMKWHQFDPFMSSECSRCPILPICLGGCPYLRLAKEWSETNGRICLTWKHNLAEIIKLNWKYHYHDCVFQTDKINLKA